MTIENDERLQNARCLADGRWFQLVRDAYGIPEIVSDDTAIAAIHADVTARLALSEIAEDHQPSAARAIVAATLELLNDRQLDRSFLPNDLAALSREAFDPIAQIVSQSGVTGRTDVSRSSISDAAEAIFGRIHDYVRPAV